jgi:membrane fusion protein (multidrug efflux system)
MSVPGEGSKPADGDRVAPLAKSVWLGALVVIMLALGSAVLLAARRNRSAASEGAQRERDAAAGPLVRVVDVVRSPSTHHLVLLGEARPFASVTLYAKVSGYLQWIGVDKGDHVKADQVVAIIESPETDAAWNAAKADHEQKALTATRIKQLLEKKFVSPQEADVAIADEAITRERLEALSQQRAFERLKAPFDGTVTSRFADLGALVQNAASSQTSALPVVTVERTDRLRVYVYLDQSDAANVHVGLPGVLTMDERTDLRLPVTVSRTTGELDPRTRKLLVEFDVENVSGAIVPGSFVHVEVNVPAPSLPEIPSEALVVRREQAFVPVLAPDSTVHFRAVAIAVNDGRRVRVLSGLAAGEHVVLNVGDGLPEGARVRPSVDSSLTGKRP